MLPSFRLPSFRPAAPRLRKPAHRTALAAVLAISATGLVAAASAPANGATSGSVLRMVTTTSTQVVERYGKEPVYLYDLGVYEVADQGFELQTSHANYRNPVSGTWSTGTGANKVTKTLPAGLLKYADNIPDFYKVSVTNSAGKTVYKQPGAFCPNSYSAQRSSPSGAAKDPYPYQCGQNPFTLGYVMGIPNGWSVKALDDYYGGVYFQGPDGTYTLTVAINKPWRQALGISVADAVGTVQLSVKTVKDGGGFGSVPASAATTPGHHHDVSSSGVLSPQGVKLKAAQLAALGKAATPNKTAPAYATSASGKAAATAKAAAFNGPQPDLRTLPAYQIRLSSYKKHTYVDFGATVWNAGDSPMVVDGYRRPGTEIMDAYQYFYDANGNEVGSAPAGTMEYDARPGHQHWHFKSFARYSLLDSTQKTAVISGKESFCLAPTDGVDLTVKGAEWRPYSTDLGTACGTESALSIREVLDAGWGDTYAQYLPGQSFDVTTLPNGVYYIDVQANPDGILTESDSANNSSLRKIKLGGTVGGTRKIKVYPYGGIDVP